MLDRSPRLTLAANLTLESYVGVLRDLYDHSLMETVTGTYGVPYSSFSSRVSPSVNTLERVELEVVLLIEPAALEELQRQSGSSGKSEGVDRQLHVRVLFLSCIRLVIQMWMLPLRICRKSMWPVITALSNSRSKPRAR